MKLYFIRHGESTANVLNIFANREEMLYELTDKGRKQAEEVREELAKVVFTKIYSSPLLRAKQTAEIINNSLHLPFEIVPALFETDTGIFEGKDKFVEGGWREEKYQEVEKSWLVDKKWDERIEGGESFNDIKNRFVPFIESLIETYGKTENNFLLVGHASLYKCMFPLIFTNISFAFSVENQLGNCEYAIGVSREKKLYCETWNGKEIEE